jgi:hypothetical protein
VFTGQIVEASTVPESEDDLPTDAWGTSVNEVGAAGTSTSSIYQPQEYDEAEAE